MLRKNKKLLITLFILLFVGIFAWFILFAYMAKKLDENIFIATENLRKKGYIFSYSTLKISGNPFYIQATLNHPHIQGPQQIIDWQGDQVKLSLQPLKYSTLYCDFLGKQTVIVPKFSQFSIEEVDLKGAKSIIDLTSDGQLKSFNLMIDKLSFLRKDKSQTLALENLSLNISNAIDPLNLKMSLSTQVLNLEKFLKNKTVNEPCIINFVGDLSGFKATFPFPKSLAEWRDGGGVLEVRLLKMNWPPIFAEVEGTLALDTDMYPLGSFSSRITGYEEALKTIVNLGLVKKKKATLALFMLDLFSSQDKNGKKQLKAPLTLQNKMLSIGPVPLLKLKPIHEF